MSLQVIDLRRSFYASVPRAASTAPDSELVGVSEVARMTGMSRRWVYDTFSVPARGGIKPLKLGNKSKWFRWEVQAWLVEQHRAVAR